MPYAFHSDGTKGGEHEVAIFNKDKHKVVAHSKGATAAEAMAKAKKDARLREMFKHMEHR